MGFPARWVVQAAVTGDFDTDAAGTVAAGTAIPTNLIAPGTLSCLFTVDAETDTITIEGRWQVSDDNSTYYSIGPMNNAANVVLATGTAGADAAVTRCLVCPDAALGWKYVRPACVSGVVQGNAVDTYSMTSRYRKHSAFD